MSYIVEHLVEAAQVLQKLDTNSIEQMTDILAETRESGGRLFILGVGGSAANASHAVKYYTVSVHLNIACIPASFVAIDSH